MDFFNLKEAFQLIISRQKCFLDVLKLYLEWPKEELKCGHPINVLSFSLLFLSLCT